MLVTTSVIASESTDENVVAIVNGTVITEEKFMEALENEAGVYVLGQMIIDEVVRQKKADLGVEVDPNIFAIIYSDIVNQLGGEEGFMYYLMQTGMTQEQFLEQIEFELTLTLLAQEEIEVTPEDIIEFFQQNEEYFAQPEQIAASHILVETEAEMEEIKAQLDAGADFNQLASEHSLDRANAGNGGSLGYFPRGVMVPEFEQVAWELPLNEYGAVETSFGWHIIIVTDKLAAQQPNLDAQWDEVEQTLIEYLTSDLQSYIIKLEQEADITVLRERYQ